MAVKRSLALILAVIMVVSAIPAYAISLMPNTREGYSLVVSLGKEGSEIVGAANAISMIADATVSLKIQKQVGDRWQTVASKSGGQTLELRCSGVSGTVYRLTAVAKFYDSEGNLVKTTTKTSSTVTY